MTLHSRIAHLQPADEPANLTIVCFHREQYANSKCALEMKKIAAAGCGSRKSRINPGNHIRILFY
jgi:hypothetical protein